MQWANISYIRQCGVKGHLWFLCYRRKENICSTANLISSKRDSRQVWLMNCCKTSFRSFRNVACSQAQSLKPQPACAAMTQVPVFWFSSSLSLLSAAASLSVGVFSPAWSSSTAAQTSGLVSLLGESKNSPRTADQHRQMNSTSRTTCIFEIGTFTEVKSHRRWWLKYPLSLRWMEKTKELFVDTLKSGVFQALVRKHNLLETPLLQHSEFKGVGLDCWETSLCLKTSITSWVKTF